METVARNVFEREDGGVLERLWRDLVRWLRPRIRCAATGMDIASETVHRAIRRFFFDRSQALPRVGWDDLWAWSVAVARILIADRGRAAMRSRIDVGVDIATMLTAPEVAGGAAASPVILDLVVDELLPVLKRPERETVQLLLAGVHRDAAIAALRGRCLRAVKESRRKIREAAARVWNDSRALHPRTILST